MNSYPSKLSFKVTFWEKLSFGVPLWSVSGLLAEGAAFLPFPSFAVGVGLSVSL